MNTNEMKESLEHILSQLSDGYVDLGAHDDNEKEVIIEALRLYKEKYNL